MSNHSKSSDNNFDYQPTFGWFCRKFNLMQKFKATRNMAYAANTKYRVAIVLEKKLS